MSTKEKAEQTAIGSLSLRDYFAAKAMQGLMGRGWDFEGKSPDDVFCIWANSAYGMADAMLEARK